jgi:hypothetical protein
MRMRMIKLCSEEIEKLQPELIAIADHHDECVNQAVPDDWDAAGYHHVQAVSLRDLAEYVDDNGAFGEIALADLACELREHRKRILRDVEVLKQRAEFCERLERRFNEEMKSSKEMK